MIAVAVLTVVVFVSLLLTLAITLRNPELKRRVNQLEAENRMWRTMAVNIRKEVADAALSQDPNAIAVVGELDSAQRTLEAMKNG